jgi:hypothetical protein
MSYIIYKICCNDLPEFIYVGSTKSFIKRKSQHKHNCNNGDTQKLYTTIRENGGWDNWRIVIIEDCGQVTLTEARIKEEENRIKLKANLNMNKCHQTEEEKKEYKKQYDKKYCEANKEYIKEQIKQYRELNKEKIKEQNKEYYEANKEYIKEQIKEYSEANKEQKKEYDKQYQQQKFTCECGRTITLGGKSKHLRTNVHTNIINNKII